MGTKERLAQELEKLARIIPGIGSYQDKEDLRERDKRLRETLVERLDGAGKAVQKAIDRFQREGRLANLDRLGRLERKILHAADTIRFAPRGYSGVFDVVKVDEDKLEKLCAWDISLAESVTALEEAADGLKGVSPDMLDNALNSLEEHVDAFGGRAKKRERLLRQPPA